MTQRPHYKILDDIELPPVDHAVVAGHIDLYSLYSSSPDIIQMDLIFNAGRWQETDQQISSATAALLKEGTTTYSAYQIAEKIESYGATIRCRAGMDYMTISLFCLSRFAQDLVSFIFELLSEATFPDEELQLYKSRNIENLRIDLANNDIYCHREFTAMLFGNDHPYGYNKTPHHFDNLERHHLIDQFNKYPHALRYIFIAGQSNPALIHHIEMACSDYVVKPKSTDSIHYDLSPSIKQRLELNINDGLQASLKAGKLIESHSLHHKHIQFLTNTIFGGYFGSRLMKSIREHNGYTYNIYSHIDRLRHHSVFGIHTDVGTEFLDATLTEMEHQILFLQTDLVQERELALVKNYLMGNLLMQFDGLSKSIRSIKQIILSGGEIQDVYKWVRFLKTIEAEEIRSEARSLLDLCSFYFISVR